MRRGEVGRGEKETDEKRSGGRGVSSDVDACRPYHYRVEMEDRNLSVSVESNDSINHFWTSWMCLFFASILSCVFD